MAIEIDDISMTQRQASDLFRMVADAAGADAACTPGTLRLAVLAWILDLAGDPRLVARSLLNRRVELRLAELPDALIAILEEIAAVDPARMPRRQRGARLAVQA
jgi:hypothetical protein